MGNWDKSSPGDRVGEPSCHRPSFLASAGPAAPGMWEPWRSQDPGLFMSPKTKTTRCHDCPIVHFRDNFNVI